MVHFRLRITVMVIAACSFFSSYATDRYVSTTGSDVTGDGTSGTPWATIQYAVNQSVNGDVINVASGIYNESVTVNKQLTLKGAQFGIDPRPYALSARVPGGPAETIVEGTYNAIVMNITSSNVVVDGFHFRHVTPPGGTMDLVSSPGTPAKTGLVFSNNILSNGADENLQVRAFSNATIQKNYSMGSTGDGINFSESPGSVNLKIIDNEITGSLSEHGAIYCYRVDNVEILRNIIRSSSNGIRLSNSTGGDEVHNVRVENNDISGVFNAGNSTRGIGIQGNGSNNITVLFNKIIQSGGTASGLFVPVNAYNNVTNVTVNFNYLESTGPAGYMRLGNDGGTSGPAAPVTALCNWWGHISGPFVATNPGGSGGAITGSGAAKYATWLNYGTDASTGVTGFQLPGSITEGTTSNISAAFNDYRKLANAVGCLVDNQTLTLTGTFNFANANAQAAWALGNNGVADAAAVTSSGAGDDYSITVPDSLENITLTASSLGAATIQGPGDLAGVALETPLFFNNYRASSSFQNWTISNITFKDFDVSVIGDLNGGNTTAFNNFKILGNEFFIPADLNGAGGGETTNFQNIGIHYSFGTGQDISNNIFHVAGNGVSDDGAGKYSVSVVLQSSTSGGTVYNNLKIRNNTITVTGDPAAQPAVIRGIWENGNNSGANIDISGNIFSNASVTNLPANNRQMAFWVTSFSGATDSIVYKNNEITGFNTGIASLGGPYTIYTANDYNTGSTPAVIRNNKFDNVFNSVIVRKGGSSTNTGSPMAVSYNSFTNIPMGGYAVNNQGPTGTTDVVCNWFNTLVYVDAVNRNTGSVNVPSILNSGADVAGTGFQPLGACINPPVHNVTQNTYYATIQAGVTAANASDSITVLTGTYNEQVMISKTLTLQGIGGTKPVVNYSGVPAVPARAALFDVTAPSVTIRDFDFRVNLTNLGSAVIASAADVSNLKVDSNEFKPYRTAAYGPAYGLRNAVSVNYDALRVSGANASGFVGTRNVVEYFDNGTPGTTDDAGFRSGIAMDEASGVFDGNTIQTISQDIHIRFAGAGSSVVTNNTIKGGGVELAEHNGGAGTFTVSGNTFNGTFGSTYSSALRLKNNYNARTTTVSNNTFTGHNWGISLENYQAVTISSNGFTPATASTTYRHITVNTKEGSSASGYFQPIIGGSFTSNTFNGSGAAGGIALAFYNQDNDNPIFNAFNIGTSGNENSFNAGIGTFIYLDNQTGNTNPNATPTVPFAVNLDAANNRYDVGGGLQLPAAMSLANLFALENKIGHKPDAGTTGLVTVTPNNVYVTTASFMAPLTTPSIQRGIDAAAVNGIVNVADGVYNEDIVVGKTIQLLGQSTSAVIRGLYAGDANTVGLFAPNVVMKRFTVTRDYGADLNAWYASTKNQGININANGNGIVMDSLIVRANRNGLFINNAQNVTLRNSIIDSNRTGVHFGNNISGAIVANNYIRNNFTHGILFNYDLSGGITATNVAVNNNSITGNWYAQVNFQHNNNAIPVFDHTGINFNCNWYGTNAPTAVAAPAGEPGYGMQAPSQFGGTDPGLNRQLYGTEIARCTYSPWLITGTDGDNTAPGFQPVGPCGFGNQLYVNDNSLTGDYFTTAVGNNSNVGTAAAPFATIAFALSVASPGDEIYVDAGLYTENPAVTKAVKIFGTNMGVAGAATRPQAESVVRTNGTQGNIFTVSASDVMFDGLTLDGDDPAITGVALKSGDNADAAHAIRVTAGNNIRVVNNIIKKVSIGVRGSDVLTIAPSNLVSKNWFDAIGNFDFGYAVSLRNNFYADITDNKVTKSWTGFHLNNHYGAGGPAIWSVSGNEVHSYAGGLLYWLKYNNSSPITVSSNQFIAETGSVDSSFGILAVSVQDAVSATFTNNTITGTAFGVGLFNVPTTSNISLGNTNTITGTTRAAVLVTNNLNFNPVGTTNFMAGGPGAAAAVHINGLVMSPASGSSIELHGTAGTAASNTQTLNIAGATALSGGTAGLVVNGAATAITGNSINNLSFAGQSGNYITFRNNALTGKVIDATTSTFDGTTGAAKTLAQNFSTENKITHRIDLGSLGFVLVKANHNFVTTSSFAAPDTAAASVQRGVDAASNGFTVNLADGVYNGDVAVNKSITVLGQSTAAVIRGLYGGATKTVTVSASNVTVKDVTITRDYGADLTAWYAAGAKTEGIIAENVSNLIIDNAIVEYNRTGVYVHSVPGFIVRNSTVRHNRTGFQIWGNLDNGQIINNFIDSNFTHGLLVNFDQGPTSGNNLLINNNNISGNWYSQINFQRDGSIPTGNVLGFAGLNVNCNWYGTLFPAYDATNVAAPGYGSQPPSQFGGTDPGVNSDIRGAEAALINYNPYLQLGTDNSPAAGFQPVPGSCGPTPNNIYVNDNTYTMGVEVYTTAAGSDATGFGSAAAPFATIQKAMSVASAGDTIRVDVGNYNLTAPVTVNKKIVIYGAKAGQDARTRSTTNETVVDAGGFTTYPTTAFDVKPAGNESTFDGMTIQGVAGGQQSGGIWLEIGTNGTVIRNNIFQNNASGIFLANNSGTKQTAITKNLFQNNTAAGPANGHGIYSDNSTAGAALENVLIKDNKFTNTSLVGDAWAIGIGNYGATAWTNITIQDNTIENSGRGIYFYGTSNSSVTGNSFTGAANYAVGMFDGAISNASITVNNNSFTSNNHGIRLQTGTAVNAYTGTLTPNGNTFTGGNYYLVNMADAPGTSAIIDAVGNNTYGGTLLDGSTTLSDIYTIADKVLDQVDVNTYGRISLRSNNQYVTPNSFYAAGGTTSPKIQRGVNASSNGNIMHVQAGTYADSVNVNKSITILGPNAGINACSGSRVAEAVVVPSVKNISSAEIFHVSASDVTIDGFTIDGDNPAMASGFSSTNGADIDAAEGVTIYENNINNLTVTNNIIQNLSFFGVTLNGISGAATSGHVVSNNKIQNMGTYDNASGIALWGGGVLITNNHYTAISNNCMTNVRIGIQTENFYAANPGAAGSQVMDNNTITARRRGIFHNLAYNTASAYTLSNNNISGVANANETAFWDGILLSSMNQAASFATANTINGAAITAIPKIGIGVWNCQTAPVITGGTISGVGLGVNVNNYESYPSTGSNANNTAATIDGVTVTGATTAGIRVNDNPLNSNGATVAAEIKNVTITGSQAGILVAGSDASASIHDNAATINTNTIGVDINGGTVNPLYRNTITGNTTAVRVLNNGALAAVTQNFITGNTLGISIEATAGTIGLINNNDLSGNVGAAVGNASAPLVNANCNWFGSADAAVVFSKISGNVDYIPFLNNGTDDQPATNGFQPAAGACGAPGKFYVNDLNTADDLYTTAAGNDGNAGTAAAPYLTIQKALLEASAGDTIYVDGGVYQTQLDINKSVNIIGAGRSGAYTTRIKAPVAPAGFTANGSSFEALIFAHGAGNTINLDSLLIDGDGGRNVPRYTGVYFYEAGGSLTKSRVTGIRDVTYSGNQSGNAVYVNHAFDTPFDHTVIIDSNLVDDYQKTGLLLNEPGTHAIVRGNTITGQSIKGLNAQNGIQLAYGAYGIITGNTVTGNLYNSARPHVYLASGILLAGAGVDMTNTPTGNTTVIGGAGVLANLLSGNESGLQTGDGGYGYTSSQGITYAGDTYSNNFVHTTLGTADAVNVPVGANSYDKRVDNPAQTNTVFGNIQYSIDFAGSGNSLNVSAGTFIENDTIHTPVTITGAGATTIVTPAFVGTACPGGSLCAGSSNVMLVQANNVSIKSLTIDGNNPALTSGMLSNGVDVDARNGIITDHLTGTFNDLLVDNVTVKNIYLRGIYASSDGTFNFNGNTVQNVAGDAASIAMFNFGGAGVFSNNNVSTSNDGIVSNNSRGTVYFGNTVTGSGIHTDNNGTAGGSVADTIRNNTISNAGYGIMVFAPYLHVQVKENTVTNSDLGLITAGSFSGAIPVFTRNVVDGQNKPGSIGVYHTTSLLGFGSTAVNAQYTNNYIVNNATGLQLETEAGNTSNIVVNNNSITGNTVGVDTVGTGTATRNMTCNWWGVPGGNALVAAVGEATNYAPWLKTGTDGDPVTMGFQPNGVCGYDDQLYVNDNSNTGNFYTTAVGNDDNPGVPAAPFRTITKAVTVAQNTNTIFADPGTYAENVTVNKQLTLKGRQAGANVNTRFTGFVSLKANTGLETVITAPANNPVNGNPGANDLVRVTASGVTIDGFVLDGNNASLPVSTVLDEASLSIHARRGITNIDNSDGFNPLNNLVVKNNIIQNVAQRGISLANNGPVSTGNLVDSNLIRNFGFDPVNGGQAVILFTNAYADLKHNTIDVSTSNIGFHLQNFFSNGTMTWSDNNVTAGAGAIAVHANLFYAPAGVLNISSNTVNAKAGVTRASDTWGINLWSVQSGSTINVQNNTVGSTGGKFGRGINLWNLPTAATVTITGGTVANAGVGINADNVDPYYGGAGTTLVNVNGTNVSLADTGVLVRAAPLATAPLYAANTVTGSVSVNLNNANVNLTGTANGVVINAPAGSYSATAYLTGGSQLNGGSNTPVLVDGNMAQLYMATSTIKTPATGAFNAVQFSNIASGNTNSNLVIGGGTTVNLNGNTAARAFSAPQYSIVEMDNNWTVPAPISGGLEPVNINGSMRFTNGVLTTGTATVEFGTTAADILTGASPEKAASYILGKAKMLTRPVNNGAVDMLGVNIAAEAGGAANMGNLDIVRTTALTGGITPAFPAGASIRTVWEINPSGISASRGNVQFRYLNIAGNINGQNPASIYSYRHNGTAWTKVSASLASALTGDVYTTASFGAPSFSPWTLSSAATLITNPDLRPVISIAPGAFTAPLQTKDMAITVQELNGVITNTAGNPIVINILKPLDFDIIFNPTAATVTGVPGVSGVNNVDWEVVMNNAFVLQLRTKPGINILPNSVSRIGLQVKTNGSIPTSATESIEAGIQTGSGGDSNAANNTTLRSVTISQ